MGILLLFISIKAAIKLAKSSADGVWGRWLKSGVWALIWAGIPICLMNYVKISASTAFSSSSLDVAFVSIGVASSIVLLIHMPIALIGALVAKLTKGSSKGFKGDADRRYSDGVALSAQWPTGNPQHSEHNINYTRCNECFERFSVSKSTCPNCHAKSSNN
jgi:hypothetical protein